MPTEPNQPGRARSDRRGPRIDPAVDPATYRPMPLRTTRRSTHGASLFLGIAVLLVFGVVMVFVAAGSARKDPEGQRLGDRQFDVGGSARLARAVQENGPLLFPDLSGGNRHLYVQYLGEKAGRPNWVSFAALAPGQKPECQLRWQPATRSFRDPCTNVTYSADGTGLPQYATTVTDNGRVVVDLNQVLSR